MGEITTTSMHGYCTLLIKRTYLNKHAPQLLTLGGCYSQQQLNYITALDQIFWASHLGIQGFWWQVSLTSNKDKGSFSASAPGVFIWHYTVYVCMYEHLYQVVRVKEWGLYIFIMRQARHLPFGAHTVVIKFSCGLQEAESIFFNVSHHASCA